MSWIGSAQCSDVFDAPSSWPACAAVVLIWWPRGTRSLSRCRCCRLLRGPPGTMHTCDWQWNPYLWATVLMINGEVWRADRSVCTSMCVWLWTLGHASVGHYPGTGATNRCHEPGHIILDWIHGLRMAVASSVVVLSSTNHQSVLVRAKKVRSIIFAPMHEASNYCTFAASPVWLGRPYRPSGAACYGQVNARSWSWSS
jgi:hypothetical protein